MRGKYIELECRESIPLEEGILFYVIGKGASGHYWIRSVETGREWCWSGYDVRRVYDGYELRFVLGEVYGK